MGHTDAVVFFKNVRQTLAVRCLLKLDERLSSNELIWSSMKHTKRAATELL